ncbi:M28 family peptidase [Pseudonocardia zijingensis]|jgi:aminopeptidase S|uniref:Peptidase M28 domain-containing protein n=1 Tax=Pseudonocardia zijingensis TaxID=153376 RepID=A0ABN1PSB4_9PSEU
MSRNSDRRGEQTRPRLGLELVQGASAAPAPDPSEELRRRMMAGASSTGAWSHLAALQRIADENGGHRASPGPGYDASVEYVAAVLRAAGYAVSTPTYPLPKRRRPRSGDRTCRNVVAQTRSGDPGRVVMVGAHLDSVRKGPGVNDNGSGVGGLLEIATRLGSTPPIRNAVRFAFWGSEEDDLKGSTHYVKSLPRRDRKRILLYVNLDMIASPNAGYFVLGGEGKTAAKAGPPGSAQVACVLVEHLAAVGIVAKTITLDRESDYAPFIAAGVPTGGVMAGDRWKKTRRQASRWGGRAGERFDPNYHTRHDRLAHLDRVAMDRFTRAVAGAVARFAAGSPVEHAQKREQHAN